MSLYNGGPYFYEAIVISRSNFRWCNIRLFPVCSYQVSPTKCCKNTTQRETTVLLIYLLCVLSKELQNMLAIFYESFQLIFILHVARW